MRKLPDRVWKAPYAAEVVWFLVFPLTRVVFVWFSAEERGQPG